ncbi:MAG: hypothetical protein H6748_06185 [Spirochaetaceae bacterium]|nr:hypothetical protein [Myxococcales bacterium]MCB9723616.1 hypothetical protein [Spirochaetaceae bacterium]HPG26844.1 DUF5666 domain-containing protein [Myxococcota bacterium]
MRRDAHCAKRLRDARLASLVLVLLALVGVGLPRTARAACEGLDAFDPSSLEPGTGMGGTGRSPGEGSGSGGTGRAPGEGSGSGGTGFGADPRPDGADLASGGGTGVGGTGLLGVITGFGSVCVNGEKVELDAGTRVTVDGMPAAPTDLAIGQLVRITTRAGQPDHARSISAESLLVGPIERVSRAERAFWVLGQKVELRTPDVVLGERSITPRAGAELRIGTPVAVAGFRRADGVVTATRVDGTDRERPAQATVVVRGVEQGVLDLGGLKARPAAGAGGGDADWTGRRVRVEGRWNATKGVLEQARIEPADSLERGVDRASVQGFASPGGREGVFRIGDVEVDARALSAGVAELRVDSRVRVDGRVERSGRMRAERVFIEEAGRREHLDGRSADAVRDRRGRSERGDRSGRSDRSGRDRSNREDRGDRSGRSDRSTR